MLSSPQQRYHNKNHVYLCYHCDILMRPRPISLFASAGNRVSGSGASDSAGMPIGASDTATHSTHPKRHTIVNCLSAMFILHTDFALTAPRNQQSSRCTVRGSTIDIKEVERGSRQLDLGPSCFGQVRAVYSGTVPLELLNFGVGQALLTSLCTMLCIQDCLEHGIHIIGRNSYS